MRVFERFQSPEEAEALCQGMFFEQQLRARIDELKALRRMGARTFVQGEMLQVCSAVDAQTIERGKRFPGSNCIAARDALLRGDDRVVRLRGKTRCSELHAAYRAC